MGCAMRLGVGLEYQGTTRLSPGMLNKYTRLQKSYLNELPKLGLLICQTRRWRLSRQSIQTFSRYVNMELSDIWF